MAGKEAKAWGEQVFKAWATAQKKIWEDWYDLAQQAPASPSFQANLADQWRELADQTITAWLAQAAPTARQVAERLLATQDTSVRFVELAMAAWQAMAARVEAGESWPEVLNGYLDQLRAQLTAAPAQMFSAAQGSGELWRLYLEELGKFSQPWTHSWQHAQNHWGQTGSGSGAAMIELARLYWQAFEQSFGRLVDSPGLGYSREMDEKLHQRFQAWQDLHQASYEYQLVLADIWVHAFEKVVQELTAMAQKGEKLESLEEVAQFWTNVADPVFIEMFYTDRYIRTQGRLLNAAMTYRIRQRAIVEQFLKMNDLPTRTEVDEVHRQIYLQRKEIKTLKKTLTGQAGELAEARRTAETLHQEVQTLRQTLTELSAVPAPVRSTSQSHRQTGRTKSKQKGGKGDAALSDPDSA